MKLFNNKKNNKFGARKFIFVLLLSSLITTGAFAQTGDDALPKTVPVTFKSDGCTLFPDGCYRDCCVEHDKAYSAGGSLRERRQADNRLYKCVAQKKGWWHRTLAPIMWAGVRLGGSSFLPTPFRWGFGRRKSNFEPLPEALKKKRI